MSEEPLKSRHNLKLLRYVIIAIIIIFAVQITLYALESQRRDPETAPATTEEIE